MLVYLPHGEYPKDLFAALKAVGLEALHDDGETLERSDVLGNGPDGGSGIVIGWSKLGKQTAYLPERQEWIRCAPQTVDGVELAGGRAWIGWDKAYPPTPATLARKKQLAGQRVTLAAGGEWLIPIASLLPKIMKLSQDTGRAVPVVAPLYRDFLKVAWDALTKFTERQGEIYIDHHYGFTAAVRVLAINYRLTPDLASALDLIGDDDMWTIPATACEKAALADLLQKKSPDSPFSLSASESSAAGEPG